ncbi:hypothetical protein [Cupriavidus sp. TMH.W2]|uniref:hypothetical protein n=1 Tax=Cupriavidus sp. TMH.W2 TaxID=3434465 RepID=UPI003D777AA5
MSNFIVPLGGGAPGELIQFEPSEEFEVCRLRAVYRDQVIDLMAPDFFEALRQIRSIMALAGLSPLCYGASLDVYYIDNGEQVGKGLILHRLVMGHKTSEADLLETFNTGPDMCPATVVEQQKYYQQWLLSLRA